MAILLAGFSLDTLLVSYRYWIKKEVDWYRIIWFSWIR